MTGLTAQDEVRPDAYNEILPVPYKAPGLLVPWIEANLAALEVVLAKCWEPGGKPDPYHAGMRNALAAVYRMATCMGDHNDYLDSDCQLCGWTWSDMEEN